MSERKPIGIVVPYRAKTTKANKGWVGLTEDELKQILADHNMGAQPHRIAALREVEQTLKERNAA